MNIINLIIASVHGAVTSNLLNQLTMEQSSLIFLVATFIALEMTIWNGYYSLAAVYKCGYNQY